MTRNLLFFLLKLSVSVILIGFIVLNFDIGASYARLTELKFEFVLLAGAVLVVLLFNNTARWLTVLSAIQAKLGFWTSFRLLYIGVFFNQTLPSSVGGDAVRMYLARKEGLSLAGSINGVMLERAATLMGLILLVVATQPLLLARIGDQEAKMVFPILAVVAVTGIIILMQLDHLPERFQSLKVIRGVVLLAKDTKKLFLSPSQAILSVGLGITGNILVGISAFFLGQALAINISVLDCLVLMPPVVLITTIPISIAGWGLREGAMVTAFAFVGVAEGDAFIMSVLFGLVVILISLPGGLVWLTSGYRQRGLASKISTETEG